MDLPEDDSVECYVYQYEQAPTTNKCHVQGYIMFKYGVTFQHAKGILPVGSHIEVAKGTRQQNFDYCTKNTTDHKRWPNTDPVSFFDDITVWAHYILWSKVPLDSYNDCNLSIVFPDTDSLILQLKKQK